MKEVNALTVFLAGVEVENVVSIVGGRVFRFASGIVSNKSAALCGHVNGATVQHNAISPLSCFVKTSF